ncbi:barren protein, partial [Colletotrichum costaricense]
QLLRPLNEKGLVIEKTPELTELNIHKNWTAEIVGGEYDFQRKERRQKNGGERCGGILCVEASVLLEGVSTFNPSLSRSFSLFLTYS